MTHQVLTETTASVSELKNNPMRNFLGSACGY